MNVLQEAFIAGVIISWITFGVIYQMKKVVKEIVAEMKNV